MFLLVIEPWLSLNSLVDKTGIHRVPPASNARVLGLRSCATMPGLMMPSLNNLDKPDDCPNSYIELFFCKKSCSSTFYFPSRRLPWFYNCSFSVTQQLMIFTVTIYPKWCLHSPLVHIRGLIYANIYKCTENGNAQVRWPGELVHHQDKEERKKTVRVPVHRSTGIQGVCLWMERQ